MWLFEKMNNEFCDVDCDVDVGGGDDVVVDDVLFSPLLFPFVVLFVILLFISFFQVAHDFFSSSFG